MRQIMYVFVTAAIFFMQSVNAFAQQEPSSVQPGQVIQKFEDRLLPKASRKEGEPKEKAGEQLLTAKEGGFTLNQVVIMGATVYTQKDVDAAVKDFLGQKVDFAILGQIERQLTAKYRDDGYILSRVILEPQGIKNGIVHYRAIEGYLSAVILEGDTKTQSDFLTSAVAKMKASRPLKSDDAERYLLLIDDLPGMTARSLFRPSPDVQNASEMVITVQQDPFEGYAAVDNRGSRFLGPWEVTGVAAENSMFNPFERTTLRVISSLPADEMRFFDISHEQQLGTEGTKAVFRVGATDTGPGGSVSNLDIAGDSVVYEAKLAHPFVRKRQFNWTGYASLNVLNSHSEIPGVSTAKDKVRTLRMGSSFDFTDSLAGVNLLDVQVRQGLDILDMTPAGVGRTRDNGEPEFTDFHVTATRIQQLPGNFSAALQVDGQRSLDPLLASEEIGLGGAVFGRAYDSSEIAGDDGVIGSIELRYSEFSPSWENVVSYQPYGFYDIGKVWNQDVVGINEEKKQSLASYGAGVRVNFKNNMEGGLEVAVPLTHTVASEGDDKPARVFIKLGKRF